MAKVKDGFYKQIDGKQGDNSYVLLGAGGQKEWSESNKNSTIVSRTNDGYIYGSLFNFDANSGDIGSAAFSKIYVSNDNFIRYTDKSNFIDGLGSYWANVKVSSSSSTTTTPQFTRIGVGTAINASYSINANGIIAGNGIYSNISSSSTANGLSLYGSSAPDVYGIAMRTTGAVDANFGKLGKVQGDWATFFTMNNADNRGWIFRSGTTSYASISTRGEGYFTALGYNKYIAYPNGGSYVTTTSTPKGAIAIKFPVSAFKCGTMLKITVEIFNYSSNASATYVISGYNHYNSNDSQWTNCSVYSYGNTNNVSSNKANLTVRFGDDGTREIIWIGEAITDSTNELIQTTWNYPQIFIKDICLGYGRYDYNKWASGWDISIVTSFDTVQKTYTNNQINSTDIFVPKKGYNNITTEQNSFYNYINSHQLGDSTNIYKITLPFSATFPAETTVRHNITLELELGKSPYSSGSSNGGYSGRLFIYLYAYFQGTSETPANTWTVNAKGIFYGVSTVYSNNSNFYVKYNINNPQMLYVYFGPKYNTLGIVNITANRQNDSINSIDFRKTKIENGAVGTLMPTSNGETYTEIPIVKIYTNDGSDLVLFNKVSINSSGQLVSTVATGDSPFSITSTTLNTNLNADYLDGTHKSDLLTAASLGTNNKLTTLSVTVGGTTKTSNVTVPYATYAGYLEITSNLTTETNITETGIRGYAGKGDGWTGTITTMQYAGILTFGNPSRGWQMWATRGTSAGMYWRRGNTDGNAWGDPAMFLDTNNYTAYLGYIAKTPVQASETAAQNIIGTGNITPNANATQNLGSTGLRWANIYGRNLQSDTTLYLDSAASTSIIFRIGNNEKARFNQPDGYLGLGITPSYRLHVSGDAFITGKVYVVGSGNFLGSDSNNTNIYLSTNGKYVTLHNSENAFRRGTGSASTNLTLGTSTYRWKSAYNIEEYIGTASGSQCHVSFNTTNKCLDFIFD